MVVGDALPAMGPLARLRRIKTELPQARVVLLVDAPHVRSLTDALLAGANGFLEKADLSGDVFLEALREAREGACALPRCARDLVLQDFLAHHAKPPKPALLTEREYEVAIRLYERDSNREIADKLQISIKTVVTHLQHIFDKTGAHNRRAAVVKLWPGSQ